VTADELRKKALYDWLMFRMPRFFTGELNTGLELDTHCTTELCEFWRAQAAKINRRRRQALRDELTRVLPKDQAGDELLEALMNHGAQL
jgi:hypothetical protein